MTWPERYHPIGVPTNWDELSWFVLTTGIGTAFWGAKYVADVWHTIPRMAAHKYANPSRAAIIRLAASETSMMSGSRMLLASGAARALGPLFVLEGAMLFGSGVNYFAPTPSDAPVSDMTLAYFPGAHR